MENFAVFTAKESYQTAVSGGDIGFDRGGCWIKRSGKKAVAGEEWVMARNGEAILRVPTQNLKARASERAMHAMVSSDCDSAAGGCRRGAARSRRRSRRNRARRA